MELKGTIINVLEERKGLSEKTGEEWRSRDYVMEQEKADEERFPKRMVFRVYGSKIDEFNLAVGDQVSVRFGINSREVNGRWFTDITAYRVERIQAAPAAEATVAPAPAPSTSDGQKELF